MARVTGKGGRKRLQVVVSTETADWVEWYARLNRISTSTYIRLLVERDLARWTQSEADRARG